MRQKPLAPYGKRAFAEKCNLILRFTACSAGSNMHNAKKRGPVVHHCNVSNVTGFAAAIELACLTALGTSRPILVLGSDSGPTATGSGAGSDKASRAALYHLKTLSRVNPCCRREALTSGHIWHPRLRPELEIDGRMDPHQRQEEVTLS